VAHAAVGWAQTPAPSQAPTGVIVAFSHFAAPHAVLAPGYWQAACCPSQVPAHVPLPAQAAWPGRAGPVIVRHIPGDTNSSHASHEPVQPELQQTPSAQ